MASSVEIRGLSKQYVLAGKYTSMRDSLNAWYARLRGRNPQGWASSYWALRDISATVSPGEVCGIIGPNGAGKSTLLKILSRVTDPTEGEVLLRGRVGALLELGAGFHPELSGRENVFLSGAILGMRSEEIRRRFDEIVDFSEIEQFLDVPVKWYSSGMYVRLAFAVAAHLEPEILIVDEVLSVGDSRFQRKCLSKVQSLVSAQGRTVILVSHNMETVQRLCTKCLWLDRGEQKNFGMTATVVADYLASATGKSRARDLIDVTGAARTGANLARFKSISYDSRNPQSLGQPYCSGPLDFVLDIESDENVTIDSLAVVINTSAGTKLINADTAVLDKKIELYKGQNRVKIWIDALYLLPGSYGLELWMARKTGEYQSGDILDHVHHACEIEIVSISGPEDAYLPVEGIIPCRYGVEVFRQD